MIKPTEEETNLNERINAIEELDSRRTQGDWEYNDHYDQSDILLFKGDIRKARENMGKYPPDDIDKLIIAFDGGDYETEPTCYHDEADMKFIVAAANEMVSIIREQQELLKEARGALRHTYDLHRLWGDEWEDKYGKLHETDVLKEAKQALTKLTAAIGEEDEE